MNAIAPPHANKAGESRAPELTEALDATLYERVDELIRAHRSQLLWSTGSRAALHELAVRSEGLELAIREIAREVQRLAASQQD
jgi:hypothetical protein